MSVDVKTPTKNQFEHTEFPCGEKKGVVANASTRSGFARQTSEPVGRFPRKRRFSERAGGAEGGNRERYLGAPGFKRNRFCRGGNRGNFSRQIVLPTRFLLGGNINDPLNLGSLSDEAVNKALNENTPKSSPLAVPRHRQEVHVIIPLNATDPLGLSHSGNSHVISPNGKRQVKKKRKNKHKKKGQSDKIDVAKPEVAKTDVAKADVSSLEPVSNAVKDFSKEISIDIVSDSEALVNEPPSSDLSVDGTISDAPLTPVGPVSVASNVNTLNKTVSPAVAQPQAIISPKGRGRRKRTSSDCRSDQGTRASVDSDKSSPHRPKYKRQHSHCSSTQSQPITLPGRISKPKPRGRKHNKQFIYGNYNRYYGYRNPDGSDKDTRLKNFNRRWFEGKDVLDIGCNVGHVTLEIAKDFGPRKVVGLDIDQSLITAAKRNVRHYLTTMVAGSKKYPSSMVASFGPIAAPPAVNKEDLARMFPNNIMFVTGNYVLESDELVDMTREEYDVILALSVTKWVHLNFGDAGLKRMFRRMYKQLRPGGKLVLEPQLWPSYKKRKKLTEAHSMNYLSIQLRPEQFREFLLRDIGFSTCEGLEVPFNKAKGFQRPLQVFTKLDTTNPGSRVTTPGRFSETCSYGATPRFHVGSSTGTASPSACDSPCNSTTPGYSNSATPGYSNSATPGYSNSATPGYCNSATPGYSNSPKPTPPPSQTETLKPVSEEASFATSPRPGERVVQPNRAIGNVQTRSAPSLLETSPQCGTPKAVFVSPTSKKPADCVVGTDSVSTMPEAGASEQTCTSSQNVLSGKDVV